MGAVAAKVLQHPSYLLDKGWVVKDFAYVV
jgi:hypothetical protein